MKPLWLDRRIAAKGPHLALCLSEDEFLGLLKQLKFKHTTRWIRNDHADATTNVLTGDIGGGRLICIVCMRGYEGRNPIEVAGLLIHEAVHVWQEYADWIGEHKPGTEQEAYAIQAIAQELLAEFARRMKT